MAKTDEVAETDEVAKTDEKVDEPAKTEEKTETVEPKAEEGKIFSKKTRSLIKYLEVPVTTEKADEIEEEAKVEVHYINN